MIPLNCLIAAGIWADFKRLSTVEEVNLLLVKVTAVGRMVQAVAKSGLMIIKEGLDEVKSG